MRRRAVICALALCALSLSAAPSLALGSSPIPLPRPGTVAPVSVVTSETSTVATALASPVPKPRPKTPVVTQVRYLRKGSVCGVNAIRGQSLKAIPGRISGCGIQKPVQITELAGVRLSTPAVVDCATAKALHSWIEKGAKPTFGRLGGGIAQLDVAASYACRTRNNRPGAKISEHGRGRAIDISAVRLENGTRMTVLKGWNDPVQGQLLRKLHRAACGSFGTVLGPDSDVYHRDHFHFDTARYRSGSYCR